MCQWLIQYPRWTLHFTPTSASWLNAVEGFFAKLTNRRLKRGVFRSVADLKAAINRFVAERNDDPKPFVWPADPKRVLAAVKRGKQACQSRSTRSRGDVQGYEMWLAILAVLEAARAHLSGAN